MPLGGVWSDCIDGAHQKRVPLAKSLKLPGLDSAPTSAQSASGKGLPAPAKVVGQ